MLYKLVSCTLYNTKYGSKMLFIRCHCHHSDIILFSTHFTIFFIDSNLCAVTEFLCITWFTRPLTFWFSHRCWCSILYLYRNTTYKVYYETFCISVNINLHFVFQPTSDKSKWLDFNLTLPTGSLRKISRTSYLISKMKQKINDGVMNGEERINKKRNKFPAM